MRDRFFQALGAVLKHMCSEDVGRVLELLLVLETRSQWEIRHGGLLVSKEKAYSNDVLTEETRACRIWVELCVIPFLSDRPKLLSLPITPPTHPLTLPSIPLLSHFSLVPLFLYQGVKYLVAIRPDLAPTLLPVIIPACLRGLDDSDDDVRAASAEALLPLVDAISASCSTDVRERVETPAATKFTPSWTGDIYKYV